MFNQSDFIPEDDIQHIISDLGVISVIQGTEEVDGDLLGSQLVGGSVQQQGLARPVVPDDHQEQKNFRFLAVWVQDLVQGVDDEQLEKLLSIMLGL